MLVPVVLIKYLLTIKVYIVDLYNLLFPIEDFLIKERQQKKKKLKKKKQCHDL